MEPEYFNMPEQLLVALAMGAMIGFERGYAGILSVFRWIAARMRGDHDSRLVVKVPEHLLRRAACVSPEGKPMVSCTRPIAAVLFGAFLLSQAVATALAQAYPSRPIRFIVPFPPGGGNDVVGRIVAQKLNEAFGVPVVVDNRGGAGGTIGTDVTAKAPPDGHTMLINNISVAVNATLYPRLPYDTLKDLAPVSLLGRQPNILVAHPSMPVNSVKDVIDLARANPRQVNYASGGVGTAGHLATELFMLKTKTEMTHVPYRGLGPALLDVIGGRVQLLVSTMASALPQLKSGKLKPLAVTTAKRSAFFPELPTMAEAGVPGYEFSTWYGLLVPGATAKPVVDRLNAVTVRVLNSPSLRDQFASQGLEAAPSTPAEFGAYLRSEVAKWAQVVKASGAKPD